MDIAAGRAGGTAMVMMSSAFLAISEGLTCTQK